MHSYSITKNDSHSPNGLFLGQMPQRSVTEALV